MMDDLRLAAVAARVVAWHNRHPLARRIAAAHVHAVGYVGLPFAGEAGAAAPEAAAPPPAEAAAGGEAVLVDLSALEAGAAAATGGDAGAPEAGSLRERALARARQQAAADVAVAPSAAWAPPPPGAARVPPAADGPVPALASLQADFNEVFIDTLSPRQVARFAARVGQVLWRPPEDGPVREVPAAGAHPGRQQARVYLLTAVIETGTRKSRVLLGTGLAAPVLGARVLDTPRVAAVAGLAALVVGVPAWLLRPTATPPAAPVIEAASGAASSPDATSAAAAGLAAASAAAAAADRDAPAQAAAAQHGAGAASAPELTASGTAGAQARRSLISEEDKALARQARLARDAAQAASAPSAAASAAATAAAPVPATPSASAAVPEPPPEPVTKRKRRLVPFIPAAPASAPAPAPGPAPAPAAPVASPPSPPAAKTIVYALSTRPLRTRAEAEQVQVAMRSLLRTLGAAEVQVDVLPQGDDWRVVALPFARRADAEQARTLLVSRGMRVVVVDF